jgi:hypothetical protein
MCLLSWVVISSLGRHEMITNPFRDRMLRNWLCQSLDPSAIGLKAVSTTGSGPFAEVEFDEFLRGLRVEPQTIAPQTKVLIVGRRGWTESELRTLLEARSGKKLRVYSQEMLIAFLLTATDPLRSPDEVVERFGRGHPALTFLSAIGFDWPTTEVYGGGGSELPGDWLQLGFLGYLRYKVGSSGAAVEERHAVLRKAYGVKALPTFFPSTYRNEWGRPRSSTRLQKMAYSIASFCRNGKRRPNTMRIAVAEWEADLHWLRVTYYDGRYRFEWPSTDIW